MARKKSPSGLWSIWPVGEVAHGAVGIHTTRGRVKVFGGQYVRKHRPGWIGREVRAWLTGTDIEVRFTV